MFITIMAITGTNQTPFGGQSSCPDVPNEIKFPQTSLFTSAYFALRLSYTGEPLP